MSTTVAFEKSYQRLNSAQKEAVDKVEGAILVLAGPGTGKTQVLTTRIANILKETDTEANSILALTFTEAATKEMRERLISMIGPLGYEVKIATFHSFCAGVIADNPEKFNHSLNLVQVTELKQIQIINQILEKGEYELLKPHNTPLLYSKTINSNISNLKREGITVKKFTELVSIFKDQFEIEKDTLTKTKFRENQKLLFKNLDLLDIYQKYQDILIKEGLYDYSDMINWVVDAFESDADLLEDYRIKFQSILVDEYQDTNSAQNKLVFALANYDQNPNLFVVGDPDQCLPGDTDIQTKDGIKKIKKIKETDLVLSAVGKGYTSYVPVTKTFKNKKTVKLITFTTSSGQKVTTTDNHKMFVFIPPREISKYWYAYLMYKREFGWRMGITKSLAVRVKVESGADKIVGLRSFETEAEARCFETIHSIKYQIPTIVFKVRNGVVDEKYIKKVFSEFDTIANAKKLAKDLGVNLDQPHYQRDATTLGKGRNKINFYLCNRSYRSKYSKIGYLESPEILHEINIQSSNPKVIRRLENLGFKLRNKNIGKGYRKTSTDIKELYSLAEKIAKEIDAVIDIKSSIGTTTIQHRPATIMQAGNVLLGNYLPVLHGFEIKYEEVVSIKEETKTLEVYDLEVTPSHNFIANNIVVHNSIFRFQGASKENIKQFEAHYPHHTQITLKQNYRSTKTILDSSAKLLQNDSLSHNVDLKNKPIKVAKFSSPIFENEFIARSIKRKIKQGISPNEIAVIVRNNADIDELLPLFKKKNIPFKIAGDNNILKTPLISQFLNLLHVVTKIQKNLDDLDLFIALNQPHFQINPFSILYASRQAYQHRSSLSDYLIRDNPDLDDRLVDIFHQIVSWNKDATNLTLTEIFQKIFSESGMQDYILSLPLPITELNRFATLFDEVKSQAQSYPGIDLFGFVQNLTDMNQHDLKLKENILTTTEEAVTLTTAHKSKGLEWQVVYIYRFVDGLWSNQNIRENLKLIPGIINFEDVETEEAKNAEERRLFYVAITRAKQQIYLTGSEECEGHTKYIFPALFYHELPPEKLVKLNTKIYEKNTAQIITDNLTPTKNLVISDQEAQYLTELIKDIRLSPTSLNTFLQCPYKYKLDNLYRIPKAKATPMCFGTAVHYALEQLFIAINNNQKISKEGFIADFETAIRREILSESELKNQLKHGRIALSAFYDEHHDSFKQSLYTEKDFGKSLTSQVYLDDIPLDGKVDRIDLISQKDKTVRVIDYKTGSPKSRNEIEGLTKNSDGGYKRQLVFYHLLAELDKSFPYKVSQSVLQFIEPNDSGYFKSEAFNITSEEISELKNTIRQSHQEITSLNFSRTTDTSNCEKCPFLTHCFPEGLNKSDNSTL